MNSFLPQPQASNSIKWYEYILWTGAGAAQAAILTYIFNVLGLTESESYMEAADGLFSISSSIPVLIAVYCIATPLLEEIIFRYFIYNLVDRYTKKAGVSILITSALFGIYHMNPVQMLYGFLMGLVITYSYSRYKIITIPFLVHSAANAVALIYTFS